MFPDMQNSVPRAKRKKKVSLIKLVYTIPLLVITMHISRLKDLRSLTGNNPV